MGVVVMVVVAVVLVLVECRGWFCCSFSHTVYFCCRCCRFCGAGRVMKAPTVVRRALYAPMYSHYMYVGNGRVESKRMPSEYKTDRFAK